MARKALCHAAGISERYLAQLEAGDGNASILLLRSVAGALRMPLTELLGERDSSVERRLVRRFLEGLPRAPSRGRAVPPDARVRARGRRAQAPHRADRPARRRQDHARRARSPASSAAVSSSWTARSSARRASACPRCSCSTARPGTGASSGAASTACSTRADPMVDRPSAAASSPSPRPTTLLLALLHGVDQGDARRAHGARRRAGRPAADAGQRRGDGGPEAHPRGARAALPQGRRDARHLGRRPRSRASRACGSSSTRDRSRRLPWLRQPTPWRPRTRRPW